MNSIYTNEKYSTSLGVMIAKVNKIEYGLLNCGTHTTAIKKKDTLLLYETTRIHRPGITLNKSKTQTSTEDNLVIVRRKGEWKEGWENEVKG